jgi:hypothetical protein
MTRTGRIERRREMSVFDTIIKKMEDELNDEVAKKLNPSEGSIIMDSYYLVCIFSVFLHFQEYGFSSIPNWDVDHAYHAPRMRALAALDNPLEYLNLCWMSDTPRYKYYDKLHECMDSAAKALIKKQQDVIAEPPSGDISDDIVSIRRILYEKMADEEAEYYINLLSESRETQLSQSRETLDKELFLECYKDNGLGDAEARALAALDRPLEYLCSCAPPYRSVFKKELRISMRYAAQDVLNKSSRA